MSKTRNNAAELSRMIAHVTGNGAELLDFMVNVMRDDTSDERLRFAAAEWLSDRWAGKAPVMVEHDVHVTGPAMDVSRLSTDELLELQRLLKTASPRNKVPELPSGEVIDVENNEDGNEDDGGKDE